MKRSNSETNNMKKSPSPHRNNSGIVEVQPELLTALNAKVKKIQQTYQHLVKNCIPNIQGREKKVSFNIPEKRYGSSEKVVPHVKSCLNSVNSPTFSSKFELNRELNEFKSEDFAVNEGKTAALKRRKSASMAQADKRDPNGTEKSQNDLRKYLEDGKDLIQSIENTCFKSKEEKVKRLISEDCERLRKSLENIEINNRIMKDEFDLELKSKIDQITCLKQENEQIFKEINSLKSLFFRGFNEINSQQDIFIYNAKKNINACSAKINSLASTAKESINLLKEYKEFYYEFQGNTKKNPGFPTLASENANSLERHLSESKLKIRELENTIKNLNSYKTEKFSLISELSKSSELQDAFKKQIKIKEIECKQKENKISRFESENIELKKTIEDFQKKTVIEKESYESQIKALNKEIENLNASKFNQNNLIEKLEKETSIGIKGKKINRDEDSENLEELYKVRKEKIELESKIQNLEQAAPQRKELELKITNLEEANRVLSNDLKNRDQSLQKFLTEKKARKDLKTRISKLTEKNIVLENKIKTIEDIQAENIDLKSKISEQENEILNISKKSKDLQHSLKVKSYSELEISLCKQELFSKTKDLQEYLEKNEELESKISNLTQHISVLNISLKDLESIQKEHQYFSTELANKTEENSSLKNELQGLNKNYLDLKNSFAALEKNFQNSESEVKQLNELKDSIENSYKTTYINLLRDANEFKAILHNLTEKIDSISKKAIECEAYNESLMKIQTTLKLTNDALSEENRMNILSKSLLVSKNSELENDIRSITNKLLMKSNEISLLEDKIIALSSNNKDPVFINTEELAKGKKELEEYKIKYEGVSDELKIAEVKLKILNSELKQVKSLNKSLREKNEYLNSVNSRDRVCTGYNPDGKILDKKGTDNRKYSRNKEENEEQVTSGNFNNERSKESAASFTPQYITSRYSYQKNIFEDKLSQKNRIKSNEYK